MLIKLTALLSLGHFYANCLLGAATVCIVHGLPVVTVWNMENMHLFWFVLWHLDTIFLAFACKDGVTTAVLPKKIAWLKRLVHLTSFDFHRRIGHSLLDILVFITSSPWSLCEHILGMIGLNVLFKSLLLKNWRQHNSFNLIFQIRQSINPSESIFNW